MKASAFVLFGLLILVPTASCLAQSFRWPMQISTIDDEMVSVPVESLPRNVQHNIMGADQPAFYTNALRIDLNGDGIKELIVNDGSGGSGGPGYEIYQRRKGVWVPIADFQGSITLSSKANGYFQLFVRSRGGGGYTGRELLRFLNGRYRAIYGETYKDGVFLRAWTAHELEGSTER